MRKSIIRSALLGILTLVFAVPGVALAVGGKESCSLQGTWFGIVGPDDTRTVGYLLTAAGKSENMGTNIVEYPNYDPTLGIPDPPFSLAVTISDSRGNWVRTSGNTFDYTFTGFALDEFNNPVYISKISGQVTLYNDCQYADITATLEAFAPFTNPFLDDPILVTSLGEFSAYRARVDLPEID